MPSDCQRLAVAPKPGNGAGDLPGEILRAFDHRFLAPAACARWLLERYYPDGPACPRCGQPLPRDQHARFYALGKLRCRHCGAWFRAIAATPLRGSSLSPRQVVALLLGTALGWSTTRIAGAAHVDPETVRRWQRERLR